MKFNLKSNWIFFQFWSILIHLFCRFEVYSKNSQLKNLRETNLLICQHLSNYIKLNYEHVFQPNLCINKWNIGHHKFSPIICALQNAHPSGRVFKNAAQNSLKPRFLKTGLKEKRASRVLYAGPKPRSSSAFFTHLAAFFLGWT